MKKIIAIIGSFGAISAAASAQTAQNAKDVRDPSPTSASEPSFPPKQDLDSLTIFIENLSKTFGIKTEIKTIDQVSSGTQEVGPQY